MECKQLLSSPSLDSPTISHQHNRYHLLWLKIFYIRCIDTSNQALVSAHTSLQLSPQSFTVPPHSPLNMASPVPSTPSTLPTNPPNPPHPPLLHPFPRRHTLPSPPTISSQAAAPASDPAPTTNRNSYRTPATTVANANTSTLS